jgi:hypothetical protein
VEAFIYVGLMWVVIQFVAPPPALSQTPPTVYFDPSEFSALHVIAVESVGIVTFKNHI